LALYLRPKMRAEQQPAGHPRLIPRHYGYFGDQGRKVLSA
jgi:hypothetical protein